MSPELIAILAVGAALASLVFVALQRMDKRMDEFRAEFRTDLREMRRDLKSVETGLAAINGKLSFVENYILGRNAPAQESAEAPAE